MPLDPTISLHAGEGVAPNALASDPLGMMGKYVGIQNALNTNRLFPLIQQQHENAVQLGQTAIDTNQLALHQQRLTTANGMLLSSLTGADGKPVSSISAGAITRGISDAISNGMLKPEEGAQLLGTLPNGGSDGVANRQWVLQHFMANQIALRNVSGALAAVNGTPAEMSNGQSVQPGMRTGVLAPGAGAFTPAGQATQVYPSRSELITQQPGVGPNGEPISQPTVGRAAQQGTGDLTGPAGQNLFPTPVRQPPQQKGTEVAPGAGASAAPSGPQAAPGASPAPAAGAFGAVPTGLPPGAAAPLQVSGEQLAADRRAAAGYSTRVFPLQQAATALANTNSGPGTDTVNHIKSFLLAQSPDALRQYLPGVDPAKIQSYDEAKKYLAQYALNQPGASRSDMALLQSDISNPSTAISNAAARHIITNLIGQERMQVAAVNSYKGDPAGYSQYRANFATQYDPRGFAWDQMTPAERSKLVKGMSDAQLQRIRDAKVLSEQQGLTDAGGANGR